ncbi:hypothetical protein [Amycolatopsis tolypomycina]|uniref:hypothetical protein n=1 Tax=Amycolatopsis tolypomycina TaxID=208445 RepID=UPI0033AB46C2
MPTAIEYAVVAQWHDQNGCGGGPPAQSWVGGSASGAGSVVALDAVVPAPAEGWLVTGLPAVLLVAAAGLVRRRHRGHG